ncbi:hypothetical protein SLA2020_343540 [Shorea laevis]
MAGEKNIEKAEPVSTVSESEVVPKLADEQDVDSAKDGLPSDSVSVISSADATCGMKSESPRGLDGKQGVNPPTSCYNYYYPGYNGPFAQLDDNGYFITDGPRTDMPSENGPLVYYLPGYSPYANGTVMGVDGQNVGQQPYFSSGFLHSPVSYGSDAYSWDSTYSGDVSNRNLDSYGSGKYGAGSTTYAKLNGYNSMKTNGNLGGKLAKPAYAQSYKPTSKVPFFVSDQGAGSFKGYQSAGRYSSFNNQKAGVYPHNSPMNYRSNGRHWNQNDRYKASNKNNDFENSPELTRGPRAYEKTASLDSSIKSEDLGLSVRRDQYNLPDFQTEYENAKFFVIKSYSEDDIHKCIKYDVWSSTPNGNKKLNATYNDVDAKESENGAECPIFLFFSVNGSGQFVGLAEMVGQVDFNKDMDFWRLDKWVGFFPVKWHIIKDIPNNELRHIILENNDNKPVTFSRDTQEIGLKQGLEMLKIFSSYTAKTSLLDDFSFYEHRQKSLGNKKHTKPATLRMEVYESNDFTKQTKAGERKVEEDLTWIKKTVGGISLINLTKNLSLNEGSPNTKNSAVKNPIEHSIASLAAP